MTKQKVELHPLMCTHGREAVQGKSSGGGGSGVCVCGVVESHFSFTAMEAVPQVVYMHPVEPNLCEQSTTANSRLREYMGDSNTTALSSCSQLQRF